LESVDLSQPALYSESLFSKPCYTAGYPVALKKRNRHYTRHRDLSVLCGDWFL